jgi:hypothetical protein
VAAALCFLRLRAMKQPRAAPSSKTPPIEPPTAAPIIVLLFDLEDARGVGDGEGICAADALIEVDEADDVANVDSGGEFTVLSSEFEEVDVVPRTLSADA